jgi:hypothetical protein
LFGFLLGHKRPADGPGVFEDARLDGFVLAGFYRCFQFSCQARYSAGRSL